jgi:hypothetical protein
MESVRRHHAARLARQTINIRTPPGSEARATHQPTEESPMNRRVIIRFGALAALLAGAVMLAFVAPAAAGVSALLDAPADPSTDPPPTEEVYALCPIAEGPVSVWANLDATELLAEVIVCFEAKVKVEYKDGKPYVNVFPVPNGPTVDGKPVDPTKPAVGGFTRDLDKGKTTIEITVTCTKGDNSTKYNVKVDVDWTQDNNPKSETTITKAK